MPQTYRDVYDQWQRSQTFGDTRTMDQFSTDMDKRARMGLEGTAQEGDFSTPVKKAGWWTRSSTAADAKFFEPFARMTGLDEAGAAVGKLLGNEESGRRFGLGAPRMAAQMLPVVVATLATGGADIPILAGIGAGAAATGALTGAQTYADTGSGAQAVFSGALTTALPSIGKFSGELGAKAFGATIGKPVARALGGAAGIYGSMLGQEKVMTGEIHPLDPALLMQTIPFTMLDLYGALKAPKSVPMEAKVTTPEELPYRPPPHSPEYQEALGDATDKLNAILHPDSLATDEEKSEAFDTLQKIHLDPKQFANVKTQQPSLPKQDSPWNREAEWDKIAKLKAEGTKTPTTVEEISERLKPDSTIPEWLHEEMTRRGLNPGRTFNDVDLRNPSVVEAINSDPTLTAEQKARVLKTGSIEPEIASKIVQETHGDARQKVSAAIETLSAKKQDEAYIADKVQKKPKPDPFLVNPVTKKSGFATREDADAMLRLHRMQHPEDDENFTYSIRKRGKEFIGRRDPKLVSYEGKPGTSLENVIPSEEPEQIRPPVDIKDLPKDIYHHYTAGFGKLVESPTKSKAFWDTNDSAEALKLSNQFDVVMWAERNKKTLKAVNAGLPDEYMFKNQEEYDALKERGVQAMGEKLALRNFTLDSQKPIEPQWQQRMSNLNWFYKDVRTGNNVPLEDATKNILDWYTNHPQTPESMKQLVRAMMKVHPPDRVGLVYKPEEGSYYNHLTNNISINELPSNEVEAHQWARQLIGHEYFHHVGRKVWDSNDPAAIRFKAEVTKIQEALKNSPSLPEKVRQALKGNASQEAFTQYRITGDEEAYAAHSKAVLGEHDNLWGIVYYGLSHPEELMSMAFSSPKLMRVMKETKMPKSPMTVMQHFSAVWNALFGGSKENDNALAQFLTAYDNYLSGPRVPTLSESLRPPPAKTLLNVIGKKNTLLKNPVVNHIVSSAVRGENVIDAFSGSGQLSDFSSQAGAKNVTLNVRDPEMFKVWQDIKNNPEDFAKRVEKVVKQVNAPRHTKGAEVTLESGGDLQKFFAELDKTDPTVSTFVKQNLNAQGREVTRGSFSPGGGLVGEGLKDLSNRVREFAKRNVSLSNADGWEMLANAPKDSTVLVDPPYIGGSNQYAGVNEVTVEQQLQNYEKFLAPAVAKGVKAVVFDVADPRLTERLKQMGMNVEVVSRGGESKPELVAYNTKLEGGPTERKIPFAAKARTYGTQDYIRDSLMTKGTRPEALSSRISSIKQFYNTGNLSALIDGFQRESDAGILPAAFNRGKVNDFVKKALVEGDAKDVEKYTMGLLAETEVPVHADLWWQMRTDARIAQDLYNAIQNGHLQGGLPPEFKTNLAKAQYKLNRMERALQKQKVAFQKYVQLDNFNPDGFFRTISGAVSGQHPPEPGDPTPLQPEAQRALSLRTQKTRAELERTGWGQRTSDWLTRNFMFTQHAMQVLPGVKEPVLHSFQLQGDANIRSNELNVVRHGLDENQRKNTIDIYRRLFRNNAQNGLAKIANRIHLWFQTEEKAQRQPTMDNAFVKNALSTLNQKDRNDIMRYFDSTRGVHDYFVDRTIAEQYLPKINGLTVAYGIAARETGMRPKVALELANELNSTLKLLKQPETITIGTQKLKELALKMRPDTFAKALELSRGLLEDSDKHVEFMRSRSHYVTEQRLDGQHGIRMTTPKGDPHFERFPSRDAAKEAVNKLEDKGYKFIEYLDPYSETEFAAGLDKDVVQQMQQMTESRLNRLKGMYADKPDVMAALEQTSNIPAELEASKAAFSAVPGAGFPRRHFVSGRENLNMVFNEYRGYLRFNNWVHHNLMKATAKLDLLEPELMANPSASKYVTQHYDNMLTRDSRWARQLSEFTYNYKLAWNFGVNFLHFLQSWNTGMSELIASTGGVGDALKLTVGAQKAVWGRMANGKWGNAEHQWLDNRASAEGIVGFATWEGDIGDRERNLTYDANTPPWLDPVNKIKNAARGWNSWFFRYNDRLGLIASYDHARATGMPQEEAYQFARDAKNRAYFTGGKAQRAVGQFSIKTRAVPQLMSSLQTYVQGWFSELSMNYIRGFGDPAVKLSSAERLGARKAFLYQMGFQAVLAGALGLPGVGQGMALVKQTTGVDVMSWLRQNAGEFFDEDEKSGAFMTSLGLHGLPAALGQVGVPSVDISGRHMPSIPYIGVSPYKGFDVAQLAGAAVSTPADMIKGLMNLAQGKPAEQLIPSFLRGPIDLFSGGGDVRDQRGRLIAQSTPWEKAVMAMGMKAPRIQDIKDVNAVAQEAQKRASTNKTNTLNKIASMYSTDPRGAKTELLSYLHEHPEDKGEDIVRTISQRVADTTIPYDWRRHVNAAADVTGLGSREPSSETTRRDLMYKVSGDFGVMPKLNVRADMEALQIDELMNADSEMTLARAKQQVQQQQIRRHRFSILQ